MGFAKENFLGSVTVVVTQRFITLVSWKTYLHNWQAVLKSYCNDTTTDNTPITIGMFNVQQTFFIIF